MKPDIYKECEHYTTPFDGELVWCTHPDNKDRYEGNCHVKTCPLIETTKGNEMHIDQPSSREYKEPTDLQILKMSIEHQTDMVCSGIKDIGLLDPVVQEGLKHLEDLIKQEQSYEHMQGE